jgi:hypothetical protein
MRCLLHSMDRLRIINEQCITNNQQWKNVKRDSILKVTIKETKLLTNSNQEANNVDEGKYIQMDLHDLRRVRA